MLRAEHRLAILLHGGIRGTTGKTGLALARYTRSSVVAIIDRECAGESFVELTGIPRNVPIVASIADAIAYNPDVLAIGIAPPGGQLPADWFAEIKHGIQAGLSVANGLHVRLNDDPQLRELLRQGQWIWDIRQEPANLTIGSGRARSLDCRRVLTVGTDMAVGKMSASLEIDRVARLRELRSQFIATGQAGLAIAGKGVPLDAVRVDFAAGAMEQVVMELGSDRDLLIVEGQGSLLHPGSSATLPLLRGCQPTHLILAHRAGQYSLRQHPRIPIPLLPNVVRLYETVAEAGGALPPAKVAAISLNTHHLSEPVAEATIAQTEAETGLPCTDPVRFGGELLLDAIMDVYD